MTAADLGAAPSARPPRRVVITAHALLRAEARFRLGLPRREVEAYIVAEVRAAFAAGRFKSHKPKEYGLYGQKGRQLDPGERLVFTADERHAWIVRREDRQDVVITSLLRTGYVRRINR
jgi:hypothetical protein